MKSMKISGILTGVAVAAMMVACGGTASKSEAAASGQDSSVQENVELGNVIVWQGGKISPDKELPTVIDFNATWCGPCQKFGPVFEQVAEEMDGFFKFVSVDVDRCPEAAEQFQVSSIPQVTVLRPDGSHNSAVGYMTADELKAFISM